MGKPNFSEDFKRDAVHQITVRGYPVREVSERLGVSTYSLYKWMKLYAKAASQASSVDYEADNRKLKRQLARMTEERDILNLEGSEKAPVGRFPRTRQPRTSPRMQDEVRVRGRAPPTVFSAPDVPLPQHSSQWALRMG